MNPKVKEVLDAVAKAAAETAAETKRSRADGRHLVVRFGRRPRRR